MDKKEMLLETIRNYFQMKKDVFQMEIVREDGKRIEYTKE